MDLKKINEFQTENNIKIIENLIKINGGYITSKILTDLGIHRMYLKIMLDKHLIEKVNRGIYISSKTLEDSFFTFQLRYPKIIFSRFTALYFYGLTEIIPYNFDLTMDNNYHVDKINKNHNIIRCKKEFLFLGLTEVETPYGHKVKAYERERCICDIIKYKNKLDLEQVKKSVKLYLKDKNKDLIKLSEYSKIMGINKKVMDFVGMYNE